jgi:hypothetical protein
MAVRPNPGDKLAAGLSIEMVESLAADEAAPVAEQMAAMEPWATLGYSSRSLAAMSFIDRSSDAPSRLRVRAGCGDPVRRRLPAPDQAPRW